MGDLQMNGNYDSYLAQLFNPLAGGGQGIYGAAGIGGQMIGGNAGSNLASLLQNPQVGQGFGSQTTIWPQQQIQGQAQNQNQAQALAAVQLAQQIVARHAVHAIQIAQALQTLQQLIQNQAQQTPGLQGQLGQGLLGAFGQPGQGLGQFNSWGMQNPVNQAQQQQALQQQALQQLAQNLAAQQQTGQFRYGMAA